MTTESAQFQVGSTTASPRVAGRVRYTVVSTYAGVVSRRQVYGLDRARHVAEQFAAAGCAVLLREI